MKADALEIYDQQQNATGGGPRESYVICPLDTSWSRSARNRSAHRLDVGLSLTSRSTSSTCTPLANPCPEARSARPALNTRLSRTYPITPRKGIMRYPDPPYRPDWGDWGFVFPTVRLMQQPRTTYRYRSLYVFSRTCQRGRGRSASSFVQHNPVSDRQSFFRSFGAQGPHSHKERQ